MSLLNRPLALGLLSAALPGCADSHSGGASLTAETVA
jgi:hypothetical protein